MANSPVLQGKYDQPQTHVNLLKIFRQSIKQHPAASKDSIFKKFHFIMVFKA
jgi:hypothetical protein